MPNKEWRTIKLLAEDVDIENNTVRRFRKFSFNFPIGDCRHGAH
jgi:hypothetical protein